EGRCRIRPRRLSLRPEQGKQRTQLAGEITPLAGLSSVVGALGVEAPERGPQGTERVVADPHERLDLPEQLLAVGELILELGLAELIQRPHLLEPEAPTRELVLEAGLSQVQPVQIVLLGCVEPVEEVLEL